ncbi:MAG TPA: zinc dependent phospholipase C family protein [Terriglobia bacterium]|nr:zinc dependent phospholipase C family protein [Terriglobia bacterium]
MKTPKARGLFLALAVAAMCCGFPAPAGGYSVLSHESIVDSLWSSDIRVLLLKRFPSTTPDQLREAHAYAYGGCIIQDLGYYPFGNRFFSDLTHYVRTGDFVLALIRDSRDVNEYAFALGALAHYTADNRGHPVAVNRSVPIVYPKLQTKFGNDVTFEDDPRAHVMVEFAFDVVQVAASGYVPSTYHDFIGFKVSRELLDRAFEETYGLNTSDVFRNENLAIETYRRSASEIIPQLTRVAWEKRKDEILKADPQITRRGFEYHLSHRDYDREWGHHHRSPNLLTWRMGLRRAEPDFLARFLVYLFQILPKIGPLRTLAFKVPTAQADQYFASSYKETLAEYDAALKEAGTGPLKLKNEDLDTGKVTTRGEYRLADTTYGKWVDRLAKQSFAGAAPLVRGAILSFYAQPAPVGESRKEAKRRKKTEQEVEVLKHLPSAVMGVAKETGEPSLAVPELPLH